MVHILELSFIVFLVRPYFKNFNKRLVKSPKLYFYDTGLLCYLLNISSFDQLGTHFLRGGIFESFVISDITKNRFNQNQRADIYFWRDKVGHEVDCLIEEPKKIKAIEIKSSKTINSSFFSGLSYWSSLSQEPLENNYLVYAGDLSQKRTLGKVVTWNNLEIL